MHFHKCFESLIFKNVYSILSPLLMEYDNNIKAYQEEVFFLKVKMIFKQILVLYIYFFLLFFNCVEKTFSNQMHFRLYTADFIKLRFVRFKVGKLLTNLKTVSSNNYYVKENQYNNCRGAWRKALSDF